MTPPTCSAGTGSAVALMIKSKRTDIVKNVRIISLSEIDSALISTARLVVISIIILGVVKVVVRIVRLAIIETSAAHARPPSSSTPKASASPASPLPTTKTAGAKPAAIIARIATMPITATNADNPSS